MIKKGNINIFIFINMGKEKYFAYCIVECRWIKICVFKDSGSGTPLVKYPQAKQSAKTSKLHVSKHVLLNSTLNFVDSKII